MFRRRTFLIGCSSLVAVPAFAGIVPRVATASVATVPAAAAIAAKSDAFDLHIAGWDPADPQVAADAGLWVQVSSSWQVAWR